MNLGVEEGSSPPSLVGYSRLEEKLDSILDELQLTRIEQRAVNGVKSPGRFRPVRRPETALQRRRRARTERKLQSIEERMLPKKG